MLLENSQEGGKFDGSQSGRGGGGGGGGSSLPAPLLCEEGGRRINKERESQRRLYI